LIISEEGNFLALDLGGTNFRVLLISLRKDRDVSMKSRIYPISQETMTGAGTQVCNGTSQEYLDTK
jgi:hexokinase